MYYRIFYSYMIQHMFTDFYHHFWFQVDANVEFVSSKRAGITFSPNDPAVDSFLQV